MAKKPKKPKPPKTYQDKSTGNQSIVRGPGRTEFLDKKGKLRRQR